MVAGLSSSAMSTTGLVRSQRISSMVIEGGQNRTTLCAAHSTRAPRQPPIARPSRLPTMDAWVRWTRRSGSSPRGRRVVAVAGDHHDSVRGVWLVTAARTRTSSSPTRRASSRRCATAGSTPPRSRWTRPLDDVVRPTPPGQRVDADQQGPRRSPRGGRADGAGRRCCRRLGEGVGHVDPDGPGRGPGRAGRPGRGVRRPPRLTRALGVLLAVVAEEDPGLDRAGQEARDAGRARADDGREGCAGGEVAP